jgi:two-component system cell cycle sensor histidine kinase/response regulator CckA
MLPSIVGEQIKTTTRLAESLGRVKADAAQLEQVLVNLVLNARDAMPQGGELTIETANVDLDSTRLAKEHLSLAPGPYVMLLVRDTGVGMDADARAHAFEPFFTTKAKGQGSGIGLATAYGIIDQSGGGISIETAPGNGTTIRVYLPVSSDTTPGRRQAATPLKDSGTESVLVVDDNDGVRAITVKALRRRGYAVFESRTAEEAIEWAATSGIRPHLLVTDVVMPGLSGPNLAARLLQQNPSLRVLYISGYTDESSVVDGSFWGDIPLLQKPFTPAQLAERVRLALDTASQT